MILLAVRWYLRYGLSYRLAFVVGFRRGCPRLAEPSRPPGHPLFRRPAQHRPPDGDPSGPAVPGISPSVRRLRCRVMLPRPACSATARPQCLAGLDRSAAPCCCSFHCGGSRCVLDVPPTGPSQTHDAPNALVPAQVGEGRHGRATRALAQVSSRGIAAVSHERSRWIARAVTDRGLVAGD